MSGRGTQTANGGVIHPASRDLACRPGRVGRSQVRGLIESGVARSHPRRRPILLCVCVCVCVAILREAAAILDAPPTATNQRAAYL
jgi:hypothetical protein